MPITHQVLSQSLYSSDNKRERFLTWQSLHLIVQTRNLKGIFNVTRYTLNSLLICSFLSENKIFLFSFVYNIK